MQTSSSSRPLWFWLLVALLIIVLDQISKWAVVFNIPYQDAWVILPVFNLTHVYNPGAAFSFLADAGGWQRHFFSALAVGASIFIVVMLRQNKHDRFLCWALALVLGGAIGNLIDRVLLGHVIDFIQVHWQDNYFPAFNVADSAISIGAVLMLWDGFFRKKPQPDAPV
jgi:signal peptidase II